MHLGLHDPDRTAQRFGRSRGFIDGRGNLAGRHRDAVAPEYIFRLILVQVHRRVGPYKRGRVFSSKPTGVATRPSE